MANQYFLNLDFITQYSNYCIIAGFIVAQK